MAKSLVTNVSLSPITLPPPYIGIIPPGVSVVIGQPTATVIAALYAVPEVARFLSVSETSDASADTIKVSTATAASALEVTLADITGPLDLNGQRAINAGTPVAATDLATKAYVDAHGGSGGTVTAVTAAAPLASTGGATPEISLNDSGVGAGTYGDPAASPEAVMPVVTVTAKGLVSSVTTGSIKIGGSTAKTYVDDGDAATLLAANTFAESLAFGISSKDSVHTATTAPLPANTPDGAFQILTASANGLLPDIGGHTLTVGQRVLVKDEVAQVNNGIYVVTSLGANDPGGSPWVLTRASDANTAGELCGSMVPVEAGTLANTVWLFASNSATFVFGTTPVIWTELSVGAATTTSLGTVVLGAGLGGAGTSAALPKLDMDHASSGTLARERGGTGLAVAGAAGNVLTSDGTNWASSPIPNVSIARTYFVAVNGSDVTGDGSLSKPFATIGAAQTQASADLASTDYARIVVGPGTYVGNVTINRARTLIEGSGDQPQVFASRISGQVLVNLSGTSKFADVLSISGFYIQPAGAASDSAFRIVNSANTQIVVDTCYITTTSTSAGAWAIEDGTTATGASRPRLVIQDCVVTVQSTGPTKVVDLQNAEVQVFRSAIRHGAAGQALVTLSGASTIWADSTIFDAQTTSQQAIVATGAVSDTKLLISNSSITNTLNGNGILLNTGVTAYITQTQFALQAGATYAVAGAAGILAYANLTFASGPTALQPTTLVPSTETHGTLLLPSLGAGVLVKASATAAASVVAPGASGNILTSNGTSWTSAAPAVAGSGLIPVPAGSSVFSAGTPVTINNLGVLAIASATNTDAAPAIGFYNTVSGSGYIRTAGEQTVSTPLVTGQAYYLALGGGLTDIAPTTPGSVIQFLGRALNATTLFVSPATIVVA